MSSDLVNRLPSIYRNAYDIKNKSSAPNKGHPPPAGPPGTSGKAGGKCYRPGDGGPGFHWSANRMCDELNLGFFWENRVDDTFLRVCCEDELES